MTKKLDQEIDMKLTIYIHNDGHSQAAREALPYIKSWCEGNFKRYYRLFKGDPPFKDFATGENFKRGFYWHRVLGPFALRGVADTASTRLQLWILRRCIDKAYGNTIGQDYATRILIDKLLHPSLRKATKTGSGQYESENESDDE